MPREYIVIEGFDYREEIEISQWFLTIERVLDLWRSLLIYYQGKKTHDNIKHNNIFHAKVLVNTTVVFALAHFFLISFQFYISWFLLQDVIKTWADNVNDYGTSRKGSFRYSRQKLHSGYIDQEMEILEEQADISLIALGLVFGFLLTLAIITLTCLLIVRVQLDYKDKVVALSKIHLPKGSLELNSVNDRGEFEPVSDEEDSETLIS